MIQVTTEPIRPGTVIDETKTESSGCVATYVGLIRNRSHGKHVLYVEYGDAAGNAVKQLEKIAAEMKAKWPLNEVSICHRVGRLKVGEVNFLVAVAAAHRREGFAACRYAVDQFKKRLPTTKTELYEGGGQK
jgi:molybdopterin synthase catalytic subunit